MTDFMPIIAGTKIDKYSVDEKGFRKVIIKTVDSGSQLNQSNTDPVLQEIQNLLYQMEI
jgi:hypothetical protein